MKNIKILIVLLALTACDQTQKQTDTPTALDRASTTTVSDEIENTNSLMINENLVIFLMPDATEISEMQSKYDEDAYAEIAADMTWYPGIASEQLDSLNIKSQYSSKNSIIIKHTDNSETVLIRKELDGDMILINPDKKPIITYSVDFDKIQTLNYFDRNN